MSDFFGAISIETLKYHLGIYVTIKHKIDIRKLVVVIKLISVNLPESYIKVLEILVTDAKFPNRSEAIRVAIRDLIKTEYLIEESIKKDVKPSVIDAQVEKQIQENFLI